MAKIQINNYSGNAIATFDMTYNLLSSNTWSGFHHFAGFEGSGVWEKNAYMGVVLKDTKDKLFVVLYVDELPTIGNPFSGKKGTKGAASVNGAPFPYVVVDA